MIVEGIKITTNLTDLTLLEACQYIDYVQKRVKDTVVEITITACDDGKVDVGYLAKGEPFERIRRITGYLTGDLKTWNNAKQAEESERVKHVR